MTNRVETLSPTNTVPQKNHKLKQINPKSQFPNQSRISIDSSSPPVRSPPRLRRTTASLLPTYEGFGNKSGLDIGVCHLHEADHFGNIKSYPGYSDSLWPPPSWIWSIDRLKRIGLVETAIEGILDKVPENYKTDVKRAGDPRPTVLKFVRFILKLKKMAIRFHEEEENEFKNKLHEVDGGLFVQARTWNHATTEERLGKPGNFKTRQASHENILRLSLGMLRKRDAYLFYIEE